MKQFTSAGKALSIIFAVLWMAGCASTDTTTSDADAEAERQAAEEARRAAEMQAEKDRQMAINSTVLIFFQETSVFVFGAR